MISDDWLVRYQDGQCEAIWRDMSRCGELEGSLLLEANRVAQETMKRVRFALEQLAERLRHTGYVFVYPDEILVPPAEDTGDLIQELEHKAGPIPIALRAFWEQVGTVNFIGAHPDWPMPAYFDLEGFPNPRSTDPADILYADPLVVLSAEVNLRDEYDDSYALQVEEGEIDPEDDPFHFVVAPCALHKANVSGSTQEVAPGRVADPELLGLYTGPTSFVSYLRASLQHAGFAGLTFRRDPSERARLLAWAQGVRDRNGGRACRRTSGTAPLRLGCRPLPSRTGRAWPRLRGSFRPAI